MADVFISYSRKDKEFVRRLDEALVAQNREAWIDWKDIPLTAEWQREIFANIEAADNFIFVISPESSSSANCRKEIVHAAANNKRMVPIFYRPVPDEEIPESLGRFQRIDFCGDDHFDSNFRALVKALETDLNWVQTHTRLLTRAKEWERERRDRSFLLRGTDLREAEQMVAKAGDREPRPTTLQSQYILASRQSATKTQRIIIGGVVTALAVAIGLAIYAFLQENVAQKETRIAQEQATIADANAKEATSQRKAAQKNELEAKRQQGIAEDETAKAVLQARITNARRLATESLYRFGYSAADLGVSGALAVESLKAYPTAEGMKALLQVLRSIPAPPKILANAHRGAVAALAFSRDGRWMASAGTDGQVLLWDMSDQLNHRELEPQFPFYSPAGAMDFSPDGRWLAAACVQGQPNGAVCIWDTSTGKATQPPLTHDYILHSLAFSPDGQYLATSTFGTGPGREIRLFRRAAERWEEDQRTAAGKGVSVSVAFAKTGVLAVADDSGVWLTQPGASHSTATYKFGDAGSCFALSFGAKDAQTLAALCRQGVAIGRYSQGAYDLKLSKVPVDATADLSMARMSLAPNGEFVVIGNLVFSVGDGDRGLVLSARDSAVTSIEYAPTGNVVVGGLEDGSIALWPTTQGNFAIHLFAPHGSVTGVSVSPDERILAAVAESGDLLLYDISDCRRIRRLQTLKVSTDPKTVLFSPNGRFIAVTANDGVRLLNAANLSTVASPELSGELQTTFSFDSRELVTLDSSGIHRINTENGNKIGPMITGGFQKFTLSPDAEYLAAYSQYNIGGKHHYIKSWRVWKLSNGVEVAWEEQGRQRSDGPATRPSQSGPQQLVKAAAGWSTPAELRSLSPDGVWPVESPDGMWRVELARNPSTLLLEEADAKRPIASLEHDGPVINAAFSPKGRWLVSSSKDGTVRLWPMKNDDLTAQACRMLPRNLTPAEWKEFRMDGPYRKACLNLP